MGAQRGAQESRQNDFIKINCTFVSFFHNFIFYQTLRMGGLPPEAFREGWWVVLDSNQRPLRCQRNALTN